MVNTPCLWMSPQTVYPKTTHSALPRKPAQFWGVLVWTVLVLADKNLGHWSSSAVTGNADGSQYQVGTTTMKCLAANKPIEGITWSQATETSHPCGHVYIYIYTYMIPWELGRKTEEAPSKLFIFWPHSRTYCAYSFFASYQSYCCCLCFRIPFSI